MLIKSSALSHVDFPFRFAAPYSVTMKFVAVLGVVTIAPGVRIGAIRDSLLPSFRVLVDGVQMKLWPPFDRKAPITKSSCPPVPLIC